MVSQGLAFIDITQSAPENWELRLTHAGIAAVRDEDYNPDDASGYLEKLSRDIPGLSQTTATYLREAVRSYAGGLYLAATVMVGVASEAAVLEMAGALAARFNDDALKTTLANARISYYKKFQEIRKMLESSKAALPAELTDGMSLLFESVLDLLRVNRNDAGHPSGKHFGRDDCFIALRMASRYLQRIYALKESLGTAPP